MGFLKTGVTEMQVYLTDYGKAQILSQTFVPVSFSINDSDVNYKTNQIMNKSLADISGDYDDCAFSLSKNRNIKGSVIYKMGGLQNVEPGFIVPPAPVTTLE